MAREQAAHEPDADGSEDDGERLLSRRSYLGLASAAVASAATVGSADTVSAATRVNIVDEGADNTGNSTINSVLENVHGDGVEVYFPPGTYLLDPIRLSGSNWSLVGDDATIVVPGHVDRRYLYLGGSGWTMDGFTIDLSADGAAPINYLRGSNWEFKNIDFVGQMSDPDYRSGSNLLYPAVGSSSGTGLIENVTATDGSADPDGSSNRGLTWFGQNNEGKMTWRGCHFAGWANNTLYGANSAGRLVIEDCLFENTNVGIRIGGNTVMRNCVIKQDGRVPAQRWTGGRVGRGLWINSNQYTSGEVVVEGCDFKMTGPDATSAIHAPNDVDNVVVRNTCIEQSNEKVAISLPGSGSLTTEKVSLVGDSSSPGVDISNRDGSSLTGMCVNQPGTGICIRESSNCSVTDSTIVVDGDAFDFRNAQVDTSNISQDGTCQLPDTSWGGSSSDTTDGSTSDGSTSDGSTSDGSTGQTLENTLTIRGSGTATNYEFTVDGELAANPEVGDLQSWDTISGTTATGWVTSEGDADGYQFSGSVTDFSFPEGDARVFVNGEEVNPQDVVSSSALPRTITLRGTGTATNYQFQVDGKVNANPELGDLQQWDTIDGSTVTGWVSLSGDVDSYRFEGDIASFEFLEGDCEVLVDGEAVDPSTLGSTDGGSDGSGDSFTSDLPHRLIIGQPDDSVTNAYTVEVTQAIEKTKEEGATVEADDVVEGQTASGTVSGHSDAYRFDGSIVRFQIDGTARVDLSRNV